MCRSSCHSGNSSNSFSYWYESCDSLQEHRIPEASSHVDQNFGKARIASRNGVDPAPEIPIQAAAGSSRESHNSDKSIPEGWVERSRMDSCLETSTNAGSSKEDSTFSIAAEIVGTTVVAVPQSRFLASECEIRPINEGDSDVVSIEDLGAKTELDSLVHMFRNEAEVTADRSLAITPWDSRRKALHSNETTMGQDGRRAVPQGNITPSLPSCGSELPAASLWSDLKLCSANTGGCEDHVNSSTSMVASLGDTSAMQLSSSCDSSCSGCSRHAHGTDGSMCGKEHAPDSGEYESRTRRAIDAMPLEKGVEQTAVLRRLLAGQASWEIQPEYTCSNLDQTSRELSAVIAEVQRTTSYSANGASRCSSYAVSQSRNSPRQNLTSKRNRDTQAAEVRAGSKVKTSVQNAANISSAGCGPTAGLSPRALAAQPSVIVKRDWLLHKQDNPATSSNCSAGVNERKSGGIQTHRHYETAVQQLAHPAANAHPNTLRSPSATTCRSRDSSPSWVGARGSGNHLTALRKNDKVATYPKPQLFDPLRLQSNGKVAMGPRANNQDNPSLPTSLRMQGLM